MNTAMNGTLSRSLVSGTVLQEIRRDIMLGRYPAGSKLTELYVSERYKISRSPVRAIMQQLEKEGMLEMLDNGCKLVVGFGRRDVHNLYEFRSYIENTAVGDIFGARQKRYAPLVKILSELEGTNPGGNDDRLALDIEFHRAIIAMADNRYILSAYDSIAPTLYTIFQLSVKTYPVQFGEEFIERHTLLIKSLIADSCEACLEVFREHHKNALDRALSVIERIESGAEL